MRLIDADELMKNVKKWLPPDPCGREEKEFPFETDICVSMLMEIEEAPTVGEMHKKGRWIPVTYRYVTNEKDFPKTKIMWEDATEPDDIEGVRCSECGTTYDFTEARNWCSECGADMRKT